jgi:hypothetical protein
MTLGEISATVGRLSRLGSQTIPPDPAVLAVLTTGAVIVLLPSSRPAPRNRPTGH